MTIPAKTVAQLDAIQQALLQNIAHHESKTNPIPGYGNSKLRDANTLATTSLAGLTSYIRNMEDRDEVQSFAILKLLEVLAARQEAGKSKVSIKPLVKILNTPMKKVRQDLRDSFTVTGRISAFQPALQELPRKTEEPIHRETPKVFVSTQAETGTAFSRTGDPSLRLDHRMDSFLYMLAKEGVPPGTCVKAAKPEAGKGPIGEEFIDAMIDDLADAISKTLGIPKEELLRPTRADAAHSDQSPQPTKEAPQADLPQTLLTLQAQVPGLVAWLRNYAQSGECHGRGDIRLRLQEWADGVTKLAQQAATAQLQQGSNKASN